MNNISDEFKELVSRSLSDYNNCLSDNDDETFLTIDSPCQELGSLKARVLEKEIIISIKNFHTHIDSRLVKIGESDSIASHAISMIKKIIGGDFYFNETYTGDKLNSPGAGPQRLTKGDKKLLVQMFGEGTYTKEWSWFGAVE